MEIPKKIEEKIIYSNPWRRVLVKKIQWKAWIIQDFPIISHVWEKFATMVFPVTKKWEVIFNKEWRPWIEDHVYNFPIWMKEKELTFQENAEKELQEEVWCVSNNIVFLWESLVANFDDTIVKYFLALECDHWENNLEDWEHIEVQKCDLKEFQENIISWKINCPLTLACYTLAKSKNLI